MKHEKLLPKIVVIDMWKNKRSCEIYFKYKSQVEKYKVCKGMPVIATQNMKKTRYVQYDGVNN